MSTIEYLPYGRASVRTGTTYCDRWLNSAGVMTSFQKSAKPAARAISGACSVTLVEPPIAIATMTALRIESRTTMSRGFRPFAIICARYSTSWSGNSLRRRGSSDGGATMCSGCMPTTPMKVCMVL